MTLPLKTLLRSVWHVVRATARGFATDELMTRAAALAFYSALSFAPLLVLLLWIASSLRPEWQVQLVQEISNLVGSRAAEGVQLVIDNARQRPGFGSWAGLLGLGVMLVSASLVFAQLQGAINRVWGLRAHPGRALVSWLRARMHALGLILAMAFLLIISFAASALIALFARTDSLFWHILDILFALTAFVFVFAAIFKVVPDAIVSWRDAFSGAAFTVLLFSIGKLAIGYYLDHSSVGGAYGPAGGVVVLLVWVYYSSVILLVGAELTEAIAAERGTPIRPSAFARASAERRCEKNGDAPECER